METPTAGVARKLSQWLSIHGKPVSVSRCVNCTLSQPFPSFHKLLSVNGSYKFIINLCTVFLVSVLPVLFNAMRNTERELVAA